MHNQNQCDLAIVGAGAAGLMCAITAANRGRSVCIIDHNSKPAEKIRISGGGRCNFTNLHTTPSNYLSNNPRFCISALSRYTPQHFINLVKANGIAYHEKKLGQLFCDGSALQIIDMFMRECANLGVRVHLSTNVIEVTKQDNQFHITTNQGMWKAGALVVASGGLSIPKMGATGWGYDIARQFGLPIIAPTAALVPFTLKEELLKRSATLSGIAVDASVAFEKQRFDEGMLFTHRGLSGPAILQISSYWQAGKAIILNLCPEHRLEPLLIEAKTAQPKTELVTVLAKYLPKRLAGFIVDGWGLMGKRLCDLSHGILKNVALSINQWQVIPNGSEGYRTAEVTKGGVDTQALSSQTMESSQVPGLYFIGEVVDVTGHLGGYNFQWAWASGYVAGMAV